MPPQPRARWSVDPKTVKAVTNTDGSFTLAATVLDNGVPTLTPTLTITADRQVRLMVHGEPGAQLAGFDAWSDI